MPCSRGKASPDDHTKLRLFADSGGYCQRGDCTRKLFLDVRGVNIHIAEIAHIIAAADDGPRANVILEPQERGHYDNLILLCPSCHTEIDKAPAAYPDKLVANWKRNHVDRLREVFGVVKYESRRNLRDAVEPILSANKAIFDEYGPHREYSDDPEAEEAHTWKRKVVTSILPNSRRVLAVLDANRSLLSAQEKSVLELFRQHVDDLTARHLGAPLAGGGRRFPQALTHIAEGEDLHEHRK